MRSTPTVKERLAPTVFVMDWEVSEVKVVEVVTPWATEKLQVALVQVCGDATIPCCPACGSGPPITVVVHPLVSKPSLGSKSPLCSFAEEMSSLARAVTELMLRFAIFVFGRMR